MNITPFTIRVGDEQINDLRRRLDATRWPGGSLDQGDDGWAEGTSQAFLRRLVEHWRTEFDWRRQEKRLNGLPHFLADVDGLRVHFVHQRGQGPSPLPLILTHGWPGSFVEMEQIIPFLADPGAHGGDPADAFHVVVPSLPGYGFSQPPSQPGVGPQRIAHTWAKLMAGLGYGRFGAQGGDWGASVSTWLAHRYPDRVAGLHLNFIPGSYRPPTGVGQPPQTPEEKAFLATAERWRESEGAYGRIQGTKPRSLAYGLTDSPAGLAGWIVEKFRAWSDCDGDVERHFTMERLLTNISLYWFTGTIGSSVRLYLEGRLQPVHFAAGERVAPPLGCVVPAGAADAAALLG